MAIMLPQDIHTYNAQLLREEGAICAVLAQYIITNLPEASSKVRHGHPVWFLQSNPVVGYSKQKNGICVLFRSGQSFHEVWLSHVGKFKAAQAVYTDVTKIDPNALRRWLEKAKNIQRDYKNIVARKGVLERLV